jgi:hypothetical protein
MSPTHGVRRVVRLAFALSVVLAGVARPPASGAQVPSCTRDGAQVSQATKTVAVVSLHQKLLACDRATGRRWLLGRTHFADHVQDDGAPFVRIAQPAGHWVAYVISTDPGSLVPRIKEFVRRIDVSTGARRSYEAAIGACIPGGVFPPHVDALGIDSAGSVAWYCEGYTGTTGDPFLAVQKADARGAATLDVVPYAQVEFGFHVRGRNVSWGLAGRPPKTYVLADR